MATVTTRPSVIDLTETPETPEPWAAVSETPAVAAAPAVEQPRSLQEDPTSGRGAFGVILRESLMGMVIAMMVFLLIGVAARLLVPQLADLDRALTATFVVLFSGFGIIPGLMWGIGHAEDSLRDGA